MNERLKYLRKQLSLNQNEMAERMNLSRSHISSLENGAREITDRIINDICREFDIKEEWLRTGEGDMFVQSETFSLDEKAQKNNLTELEIDIMRGYMELPPATRNDLMALFSSIYSKHSETAASLEPTPEQIAEEEAENYRLEVLAELKTKTSSVTHEQNERESS